MSNRPYNEMRDELLSRRSGSSSSRQNRDETAIPMTTADYALKENDRLLNSSRNIDDLLGNAANMLDTLQSQRQTLKGAHKRALDILNTLGLSNTFMKYIERRTAQDWWILFGGMFLTLLFMWSFYRYMKS